MTAANMGEAYRYRSNPVLDGSNRMTVAGAQTTGDISRVNFVGEDGSKLVLPNWIHYFQCKIVNQVIGVFMFIGRAFHAKGEYT